VTRRSVVLACLLGAVSTLVARPQRAAAAAHDVDLTSIARVFLDQVGERTYTLSVIDAGLPPLVTRAGLLPAGCARVDPADVGVSLVAGFVFACERPLTFDDVVRLPWPLSGVVVLARWSDGEEASAFFRGEGRTVPIRLGELRAAPGSWRRVATRYGALGVEHILGGVDHLLFVLGLMLLVDGAVRLVKTITAFTVAHSVTLGAAVLGYIPVDRAPVEAAIALSIVLLAREIVMADRGLKHLAHERPWVVAFAFGLLHGLGFAGALGELGLRAADVPLALLFFNLGVEAGQLLFVAVLLAVAVAVRRLARNSVARARPAIAYVVGSVAVLWFFQRLPAVLGMG
jgi:hypothetical protein